jgi:hypothetical protein
MKFIHYGFEYTFDEFIEIIMNEINQYGADIRFILKFEKPNQIIFL